MSIFIFCARHNSRHFHHWLYQISNQTCSETANRVRTEGKLCQMSWIGSGDAIMSTTQLNLTSCKIFRTGKTRSIQLESVELSCREWSQHPIWFNPILAESDQVIRCCDQGFIKLQTMFFMKKIESNGENNVLFVTVTFWRNTLQ